MRTAALAWLARFAALAAVTFVTLGGPPPAGAHEGPPFPVVMDRRIGPYLVSVWTDPDIGTGTVFVVLEPPERRSLPVATSVRVGVRPVSGRLDEVLYEAEPQPVRYGERHFAEVRFDEGGLWRLRVAVDGPQGGGEVAVVVEPTPDGTIGAVGLLVYPLPFLAVGFLWWKAAQSRRRPGV